jgi:hypothetical protein
MNGKVAHIQSGVRIHKLNRPMRTNSTYHFTELDDAKHLPNLHNGYIVVPADKTHNNNVFYVRNVA